MIKIIPIHGNEYRVYLRCEGPNCIAESQYTYCGERPGVPENWHQDNGRVLCMSCADSDFREAMIASVCGGM